MTAEWRQQTAGADSWVRKLGTHFLNPSQEAKNSEQETVLWLRKLKAHPQ